MKGFLFAVAEIISFSISPPRAWSSVSMRLLGCTVGRFGATLPIKASFHYIFFRKSTKVSYYCIHS